MTLFVGYILNIKTSAHECSYFESPLLQQALPLPMGPTEVRELWTTIASKGQVLGSHAKETDPTHLVHNEAINLIYRGNVTSILDYHNH